MGKKKGKMGIKKGDRKHRKIGKGKKWKKWVEKVKCVRG